MHLVHLCKRLDSLSSTVYCLALTGMDGQGRTRGKRRHIKCFFFTENQWFSNFLNQRLYPDLESYALQIYLIFSNLFVFLVSYNHVAVENLASFVLQGIMALSLVNAVLAHFIGCSKEQVKDITQVVFAKTFFLWVDLGIIRIGP